MDNDDYDRNLSPVICNYLTDVQFNSLYTDAEELVKLLTHRCKKLDGVE